jgi:N-acetylglucosaminyldiphosphoundecaprenol N-acetyl-beta-D-mannosaminyltransferase
MTEKIENRLEVRRSGLPSKEDVSNDLFLDAAEGDGVVVAHRSDELSVLLGQPFHRMTLDAAVADCSRLMELGGFWHVVTANTDFMAQAAVSLQAKNVLMNADRTFCDGMPLVWLSRLLSSPLPERVAGSDLTPALLQRCAEQGWSVFLFGGKEETLEILRERLPQLYPGLRIAGMIAPPFGSMEEWDNERYVKEIAESKPRLFLSALGFPKQDLWIQRYLRRAVPCLAIGVGASLDFLAGAQVRAPRWMQRSGLEWFWRMAGDPGRLVKRYAHDLIALIGLLATHLTVSRIQARVRKRNLVCNGIDAVAERITIQDGSDWGQLRLQITGTKRSVVVLDCAELHRPELSICEPLMHLARIGRDHHKKVALFGAGERIGAYLQRFGSAGWLPMFSHPLALEAWVGKQTAILSERALSLRLPANLTASRVREFGRCVAEATERVGEGQRICLSLDEVNRVSLDGMVALAKWCENFGGRGGLVTLAGGAPQIRENFRIVGLDSYLSDSEMEASLSLRMPAIPVALQRPVGDPAVAAAEDDDLVLDGETLWE